MIIAENSPYIEGGQYNSTTNAIDINVRYSGGCKEHKFKLKIGICLMSYPVQCDAKLIDLTTDDYCEAIIRRKISISLHEAGLDNDYYKGASILIQGVSNSKVRIILPR